jgi:HK97 family phage major capsid protein
MAYNSFVTRDGADALIPADVLQGIMQGVTETSVVMRLGRKLRNMVRSQMTMSVLDAMPSAYFVTKSTGTSAPGKKQTTTMSWAGKNIVAEEIACIVPVPEDILSDTAYDIWGEVRPRVIEAIGAKFDGAVLFGTAAPASWPTDIYAAAVAAGNSVVLGTGADLYEDLLGEFGVISKVEASGYLPEGHVAAITMRGKLRSVRTTQGDPIFQTSMQEAGRYLLDGSPIVFPKNGAFDPTKALLISGDFSELVYSIRQDITFKVLDQATFFDEAGNMTLSLAQQDMVALRVTMRAGWQVPNPPNLVKSSGQYPFAVLRPAA